MSSTRSGESLEHRVLRRNGVLGVTGEGSWAAGRHRVGRPLSEGNGAVGTLENPYTAEYLDYLLHKHGFREVTRYHGINGFFPLHQENLTIKQAAQLPADGYNHLTARKPMSSDPTTNDSNTVAHASLTLLESRWDREVRVRSGVRLQALEQWMRHLAAQVHDGGVGHRSASSATGTPTGAASGRRRIEYRSRDRCCPAKN